jgi:hypothetical protein
MDRRNDLEESQAAEASSPHPEQEHPVQDAHGGSMAPGLVDDTGEAIADLPDTSS